MNIFSLFFTVFSVATFGSLNLFINNSLNNYSNVKDLYIKSLKATFSGNLSEALELSEQAAMLDHGNKKWKYETPLIWKIMPSKYVDSTLSNNEYFMTVLSPKKTVGLISFSLPK